MPRDIATREIFKVCHEQGMGIDGERRGLPRPHAHPRKASSTRSSAGILEIYEKFVGDDPRDDPMKVFPAVHYSMGGLWVDFEKDETTGMLDERSPRNQATNIPGLYAVGEVDYQYHGANRLGANSLLSCIYAGMVGGPAMVRYARETAAKLPAADAAFADARRSAGRTSSRGIANA